MYKIKSVLLLLLFFVLSFAVTMAYTIYNVKSTNSSHSPTPSAFSIQNPPRDSLQGEITALSGSTLWQSRTATAPAQLTQPRKILQGESILTQDTGTMTVEFPGNVTLNLLPKTEIAVIQTLPANIVFEQKSGNATYTKSGSTPVSINALTLLINQEQGIVSIDVNTQEKAVTVQVTSGSVHAAYTDTANQSIVQAIPEGKVFIFDATAQTGVLRTMR